MTIAQNFQTLTGFTPRQFQAETIARLLNRQNVLLRAPTGSGKTETAIAPFRFAQILQGDFPNKLIYVIPTVHHPILGLNADSHNLLLLDDN